MPTGLQPRYGRLRGLYQPRYARLRKTQRGTPTSQPGDELTLTGDRLRLADRIRIGGRGGPAPRPGHHLITSPTCHLRY